MLRSNKKSSRDRWRQWPESIKESLESLTNPQIPEKLRREFNYRLVSQWLNAIKRMFIEFLKCSGPRGLASGLASAD